MDSVVLVGELRSWQTDNIKENLMKTVSKKHMIVINLINTAREHKINCNSPDCNVSLGLLKEATRRLIQDIEDEKEMLEAIELYEADGTIWY